MRAWLFVLVISAAAQVYAQAPVEERRPALDDVGLAQRRVDFARQSLEQAEADARDAATEHNQAKSQFDKAKAALDTAARNLARARAAAAEARKRYDAESSELSRRQAGKGG